MAPFEPAQYPPLLNSVQICNAAGLESVVIASVPDRYPDILAPAKLLAPRRETSGNRQMLYLVRTARRILRRNRPAFVVGHNPRGIVAAWLAGSASRSKLVYHCHDFDLPPSLKGRALRVLQRAASGRLAEMWIPARERGSVAQELGIRRPSLVVSNCPRRTAVLPAGGTLRRWMAEMGADASESRPVIVRHGRIGAAHFIRETVKVLPELPGEPAFVVIGEGGGDYMPDCQRLASDLGVAKRFLHHPFVRYTDLNALLVDGDVAMNVYAPFTVNEAMPAPNKVYESMAVGLPVIVSGGNSVADDVRACGAGVAIETLSERALREALARLLSDPELRRSQGAAARRAHLAEFNYESQFARTVLGKFIAGRGAAVRRSLDERP